jgi:hypothetical protein
LSDYQLAEDNLIESWAVFMETIFTRRFIDSNYDRVGGKNYYDNVGISTEIGLELNEKVGLTPNQLEKGLIQASSFDEWEENLINLHPNLSNEIQNIFNRY